jgi:hypothetical protein
VKEDEWGVAATDVAGVELKCSVAAVGLRWWKIDAVAATLALEEEADVDSSFEK